MKQSIALSIGLSLLIAVPAFAHSKKNGTTPAEGAAVKSVEKIAIGFTMPMRVTSVKLMSGDTELPVRRDVGMEAVKEFTGAPESPLAPGAYTIEWKGMSPDDTAERLAERHHALGAERSDADGTGVGAGVARRAKKDLRQLGVSAPVVQSVKVAKKPTRPARTADGTVLGEFAQLRDQLYWEVREWLAGDDAMLPPDDELIEEARTLTYEVRLTDGRIVVMSKKKGRQILGRSWDRWDALALTFAPEGQAALGGLTSFR